MNALGIAYFYVCAILALAGAAGVVMSRNPIRGAMGLLVLILSVAGLFLALHAEFLAAIQLIVYAGAIVVLFLFVIMLLGPNAAPPADSRGVVMRAFGGALFGLVGLSGIVLATRTLPPPAPLTLPDASFGSIDAFGGVLFSDALTPFELSGGLLMVAVIGAVAVARGRQGVRTLSRSETAVAFGSAAEPSDHSGVFSHEIHLSEPARGAKEVAE